MKDDFAGCEAATISFKERLRREREATILDAAEQALAAQGLHALSMEDVAVRAGIGTGTIYLHFAGKDALIAAVTARNVGAIIDFIAALDATAPVLERLRALLRTIVQHRLNGAHILGDEMREIKRIGLANPRCAELMRALRARVMELIEEGKRTGEIDPWQPTPVAVAALLALLSPQTYGRMLTEGEATPDEVCAGLIRLYLRGIARDPARVEG